MSPCRALVGAVLTAALASTAPAAMQDAARSDVLTMRRKLVTMAERSDRPQPRSAPLRTTVSDREVNAFFRLDGPEFLPPGLVNPQLTIESNNRVRSRATIDLDAALKPKERVWTDPLAWVGGKADVTAVGVIHAQNGMGRLELETATLGGVAIPKTVLQQLVSYYTRTPETPEGLDLDKPFPLPANIRAIETRTGQATIIQP